MKYPRLVQAVEMEEGDTLFTKENIRYEIDMRKRYINEFPEEDNDYHKSMIQKFHEALKLFK